MRVRIAVVCVGLAICNELGARHGHVHRDVKVLALPVVLVPLLDHNPAAHDAIVEPVELLRVAAHLGFKRGRMLEIAERDLKGYLHVQRVEESLVPRRALRPRTRR